MKIAINTKHKGKNPAGLSKDASDAWWRWYNGQFTNVEFTAEELASVIGRGHGYTPQHRNYRKKDNFICGQHIALDYDHLPGGFTLEQVRQSDPFIAGQASFIHTTSSHSPEETKTRVVFELARPIYDANKYGLLTASLVHHFGQVVDQGTKDPARLFFGAEDCKVLHVGHVLTLETAAEVLVNPYKKHLQCEAGKAKETAANRVVVAAGDVPARLLEVHSQKLLDKVRLAPDGEKRKTLRNVSIAFGGYVKTGYYTYSEVEGWLQGAIRANPNNVQSLAIADATIEDGIKYGQLSPLEFELRETEPEPIDPKRIEAITDRRGQLEALISEIEPTEPAFLPAVAEYYILDGKQPPAAVLEMIADG